MRGLTLAFVMAATLVVVASCAGPSTGGGNGNVTSVTIHDPDPLGPDRVQVGDPSI